MCVCMFVCACEIQEVFNRYRTCERRRFKGDKLALTNCNHKCLDKEVLEKIKVEKIKYCISRNHSKSAMVQAVQIEVEKEQHGQGMLHQVPPPLPCAHANGYMRI